MFYNLLFLFVLHLASTQTNLKATYETPHFEFDENSFEDVGSSWEMKLICTLSGHPCEFQLQILPSGWRQRHDYLQIPIEDVKKVNTYSIKTQVQTDTGEKFHGTISVQINKGLISISPLQDFQTDSDEELNIPFTPKSQQDLTWLERNGVASYVPTIEFLDKIIISGDIGAIAKIIQNIVSDKSECSLKTDYLEDVSTRLEQHISFSKKKLQDEKNLVEHSKSELQRLKTEREKVKNQLEQAQNGSQKDAKEEVRRLEKKKRDSFSRYYTFSIVANKYLEKLKTHLGSSSVDKEELIQITQQIKQDEKQIQDINKKIKDLMERKQWLELRVNDNKKKVRDTENLGKISPQKLVSLEKNYQHFSEKATEYKLEAQEVERKLASHKGEFDKLSDKVDALEQRLASIEKQLRETQKSKQSDFLNYMEEILRALERNSPKVEQSLTQCKAQVNKIEVKPVLYRRAAPPKPEPISLAAVPQAEEFYQYFDVMQELNIFSSSFIMKHGVAKTEQFSCLESRAPENIGIIVKIEKGSIRVKDRQGRNLLLVIGLCSELYTLSSRFVPDKGDVIIWEGHHVSSVVVNIYQARVFPQK